MRELLVVLCLALGGCRIPTIDELFPPTAPTPVASPTPIPLPTITPAPSKKPKIEDVTKLAAESACLKYRWKNRGSAPRGYIKGMALVYARAVCREKTPEMRAVSQFKTGNDAKDALSWYNSNFKALGMSNEGGRETLRHAYTLLIGLGMQESSGKHCCGKDASADNAKAETAEAGAFQTSYNSRLASPLLPPMIDKKEKCYLEVFSEGVSCGEANWKNWGEGKGREYQAKNKACPAFSADYAAIMLRVSGGTRGHYGPLRTKRAEIIPACDYMLEQVEKLVNPELCASL